MISRFVDCLQTTSSCDSPLLGCNNTLLVVVSRTRPPRGFREFCSGFRLLACLPKKMFNLLSMFFFFSCVGEDFSFFLCGLRKWGVEVYPKTLLCVATLMLFLLLTPCSVSCVCILLECDSSLRGPRGASSHRPAPVPKLVTERRAPLLWVDWIEWIEWIVSMFVLQRAGIL